MEHTQSDTYKIITFQELHISYSLKALNKHKRIIDAASALGVSDRCLYHWMKKYQICKNKNTHQYESTIQGTGIAKSV